MTFDELPEKIPAAGASFFAEAGLPGTFNPEAYTAYWQALYKSGSGVILEAVDGGTPIGWLGGVVVPEPLTGERVGMEMFWYAHEERRGLGAMKLLPAFERWARAQGASRVWMVHLTRINADAMCRYYMRAGYELVEHFYLKKL